MNPDPHTDDLTSPIMASERLDDRGEKRIQGLLRAGDPYGEVRDAWYAKESVRDIYQIGDPQLAAEFTQQLSRGSPGPITPPRGQPPRAHYRSLGHPDHELAPLGRDQRTHRRIEQSHQANQTISVRVPQLRQLQNPSTPIRRKAQLETPRHHHSPLKSDEPPKWGTTKPSLKPGTVHSASNADKPG